MRHTGFKDAGDWTQVETIRDRAANHRDRKCRETEDTRDGGLQSKTGNTRHLKKPPVFRLVLG